MMWGRGWEEKRRTDAQVYPGPADRETRRAPTGDENVAQRIVRYVIPGGVGQLHMPRVSSCKSAGGQK